MGTTTSSPKHFVDDTIKITEKNPLVSNLERRRKRKLGFVEDISSGKVYKKMKDTPTIIPNHLNKCLEWHKTKPWLGKAIKFTLIAYPSVGENPPEDIKVFFTGIPFTGTTAKEKREIVVNGDGYNWFLPSKFLWSAHCFVQHQKDSHIICDVDNLVRTFTDENGNNQSFIFAVIFADETFKILDRSDYEKECKWWNQHTVATGGYGEKKMFLRTKSITSSEGELARRLMKKRMASIFSAISTPVNENSSLIVYIEGEFMNANNSQWKNTIFDYVNHCLAILIFIKPESPLYKYTTAFRLRLIAGYYKNSSIPLLETFDMFPDFYTSNKSSQDIQRVKQWIKTYHDQEIDDFFNILISSLDSTVSKPTRPRGEMMDLSGDLVPKPVTEQCPDMGDTPLEDIIIYKDSANKIFCFNIDQLLELEDDTNPLDPEGPKISPEFLYKFNKNFKGLKRDGKKKKKEDKCTHCKAFIDEYVLRTGSVVKSGKDLKSKVQDFCSVDCLEQYKKLEELFGPEDEDDKEEREDKHKEELHELEERFEHEKRDLESKYQSKLDSLDSRFSELQEKLSRAESTIRILRAGITKTEGEKALLEPIIAEKERILSEQKNILQQLQEEISAKTGKDVTGMSVSDIVGLMDRKDSIKDKKAEEYDNLAQQISDGQKLIEKDKREMYRLNEILASNQERIEKYESLINESKSIEQSLRDEISQMIEKHREAFNIKSQEMAIIIAERDVKIKSLQENIRKLEEDEAIEDNKEKMNRLASIEAMKKEIAFAKHEAEEERNRLQLKTKEFEDERKKILDLARIDSDAKKQLQIRLSLKEKEIDGLKQAKSDLLKKLEGVPVLQSQIEAYRISGNESKLRDSEAKLALLQGQINQTEMLQAQIDSLTTQLLQERTSHDLCKGSDAKEKDKQTIDHLTKRIAAQDALIHEKSSEIDKLTSQQERCNFNDNVTEKMEKMRVDYENQLSERDINTQKRLDDQRLEIEKDMDERYKNISQSTSLSEEKIRQRLDEMVEIERKKIESLYENKIYLKKETLDGLLRRADEAEEALGKIKPKDKKKRENAQQSLDDELDRINSLLETISMLEREKNECCKRCDKRKEQVLSLVESDVDLDQHDIETHQSPFPKHIVTRLEEDDLSEEEVHDSDEESMTPPYVPSPSGENVESDDEKVPIYEADSPSHELGERRKELEAAEQRIKHEEQREREREREREEHDRREKEREKKERIKFEKREREEQRNKIEQREREEQRIKLDTQKRREQQDRLAEQADIRERERKMLDRVKQTNRNRATGRPGIASSKPDDEPDEMFIEPSLPPLVEEEKEPSDDEDDEEDKILMEKLQAMKRQVQGMAIVKKKK